MSSVLAAALPDRLPQPGVGVPIEAPSWRPDGNTGDIGAPQSRVLIFARFRTPDHVSTVALIESVNASGGPRIGFASSEANLAGTSAATPPPLGKYIDAANSGQANPSVCRGIRSLRARNFRRLRDIMPRLPSSGEKE